MVQIIPAILATTEEEYKSQISKIENSGLFRDDWIQIDLMDNKFVQNKSISPQVIAKYPTASKIETHLMVEYPENWIDELVKIKINRIIFPVEDKEGVQERIDHIKNHGMQVGLSVNPQTSVKNLEPYLDQVDLVLIMSVNPGFQGQEFIPETIKKVEETIQLRSGRNFKIEVDGGIGPDEVKKLKESRTDYLVMGSHLLEGNIKENLEEIWEKLQS